MLIEINMQRMTGMLHERIIIIVSPIKNNDATNSSFSAALCRHAIETILFVKIFLNVGAKVL